MSVSSAGRLPGVVTGLVLVAGVAATGATLGLDGLVLVGLGAAVAAGLMLEVDLPRGGRVPLGYSGVIALAHLLGPAELAIVLALAVPAAAVVGLFGISRRADFGRLVAAAVAGLVAGALSNADPLWSWADGAQGDVGTVVRIAVLGCAFVAVEEGLSRFLVTSRRNAAFRQSLPVHLAIFCSAALLALAAERSLTLLVVAVIPLLVTRFSFAHYARARSTYDQTIQALSLLPEVAGLTPLGHGERTAAYAVALCEQLGLGAEATRRIETASRLHHIGSISLPEADYLDGPPDPAELGAVSAEILRETGHLADVAELVRRVHADGEPDLETAIIRVASTTDEATEWAELGPERDPIVLVLQRHPVGRERAAAVAMAQLHADDLERFAALRASGHAADRATVGASVGVGHGDADPGHDCR